jgi:hypothetical protein
VCPDSLFRPRLRANHYPTYRAVLDNMVNHNAHAKFAHKELDKLVAEDKQDEAYVEKTVADSAAPGAAVHLPSVA